MKRSHVIKTILDLIKEDVVAVFTTGMISREAFYVKDRKSNFYMIGSMGLLSSIGLGIALNAKKKVMIFDGDGSVLMDMGTMAMISSFKPKNLVHFVLDNESYQSTGGQPTISSDIEMEKVALTMGYSNSYKLEQSHITQDEIKRMLDKPGPTFILIKVEKKSDDKIGRVSLNPDSMRDRIMELFKK